MEVLVTIVTLVLEIGWSANPMYGAIDKTNDGVYGGTCFLDGCGVGCGSARCKDTLCVIVEEVTPPVVKKGDKFVDDFRNCRLGAIKVDCETVHVSRGAETST
jgi:hypothetical protein